MGNLASSYKKKLKKIPFTFHRRTKWRIKKSQPALIDENKQLLQITTHSHTLLNHVYIDGYT